MSEDDSMSAFMERTRELSQRMKKIEDKVGHIDELDKIVSDIDERTKPDIYIFNGKKYHWKPTSDEPLRFVEVE